MCADWIDRLTGDATIFHLTFLVARHLRGLRPASREDAAFRSQVEAALEEKIREEGAEVSAPERAEIVDRVIALAAQRPLAPQGDSETFRVHTSSIPVSQSRTRLRVAVGILACGLSLLLWKLCARRR